MESRKMTITAANNSRISFGIIPGHFATNHSHVSSYIDLNSIKNSFMTAKETAKEIADSIYSSVPVDAVICIEGTRMLGAFLAEELSGNMRGLNYGKDIYVITPEFDMYNQIVLRDNLQGLVRGKNVLLMVSSVSSGKSVIQAAECLNYYGGQLTGIAAIFSAVDEACGVPVNTVFRSEDIPNYSSHNPAECPMCAQGMKIDAMVNMFGYSKIG